MWKKIVRIVSLLVVLIICGCSSKYALSPSEFKIQMENNKYKVVDVTDSYQYEGLRKAIKELPGELTVFIVSQRTASIMHADKILVLDDGRQVGLGTHEELLESCEVYREIHMSQDTGTEKDSSGLRSNRKSLNGEAFA